MILRPALPLSRPCLARSALALTCSPPFKDSLPHSLFAVPQGRARHFQIASYSSSSSSSPSSLSALPSPSSSSTLFPPPSRSLSLLRGADIIFAAEISEGHSMDGHPENSARVASILKKLEDAHLTEEARGGQILELKNAPSATAKQLSVVHNQSYIASLHQAMERAAEEGLIYLEQGGPTYATCTTFQDCQRATGAALSLLDSIAAVDRESTQRFSADGRLWESTSETIFPSSPPTAFAIIRPPGHHAIAKGPMGFCLVDHIAVAAKYAQRTLGFKKVFILDFDVHHGNGTNDMFYNDPSVFFLSTHQEGTFPGTGKREEVGEGRGEGYTLNLPLPGGAGDKSMSFVFDSVISPAILNFGPDIILVSAGYDGHYLDPLAGLQFTSQTYHTLASNLRALARQVCNGRLAFFLEGGYHLKALSESVANTFQGLLGEDSLVKKEDDIGLYEEPFEKVKIAVNEIRAIHSL